jgi:hypothetical protein
MPFSIPHRLKHSPNNVHFSKEIKCGRGDGEILLFSCCLICPEECLGKAWIGVGAIGLKPAPGVTGLSFITLTESISQCNDVHGGILVLRESLCIMMES